VRPLWAAGMLLRRLRSEPGILAYVFLLVAATSFVFAAAPRLFERVSDDALRYATRNAVPLQRNVALDLVSRIPPGSDGGVSGVRAYGADLTGRFPPALAAIFSGRSLRVTSARFSVANPPLNETDIALRYQDGLTDATRLVAGRWPVDRGMPLLPVAVVPGSGAPGESAQPAIVEVALSTAEASAMGVRLGDHLTISVDSTDPLLAHRSYQIAHAEVQVVGLYEALDASAAYWSGDNSLLEASQVGPLSNPIVLATAYVAADTYPSLFNGGMPFHYEWLFLTDPQRLRAAQVAELEDALRQPGFIVGASEYASPGQVVMRTGLLPVLDRYVAQRASSGSILAIAAIGPFVLAGGALAMIAILLVTRRRRTLALARGRGASSRLVLGAQLWEAILIAGSASLVGLAAAAIVIPASDSLTPMILSTAVGMGAILLLLGATWSVARRPLGQLERDDPPVLRVAPRRLVMEMTVVGIAAAGVLLLRQRGLTFGASGSVPQFDPLLAAVPVLSGVAAGIVAMRLYPLPIRALGWLAAGRRGLVAVLGLRAIGRRPAATNLPVLVLMLTAAFGAFALVIGPSVDRGQVVTSYQDVGADYRVERIGIGALPASLDPARIPGVQAVATGVIDASAGFASQPDQQASIYLEAVDPQRYEQVTAGTAADPRWPTAFLVQPAGTGLGTETSPIPAILSSQTPFGSAHLGLGDTFGMTVNGRLLTFQVAERRASFPGISPAAPFAVVPFTWVQAASANGPLPASAMWLRASADVAAALRTAAGTPGTVRVISRYDAYAALHDAPLGGAIGAGFSLALLVAAAYTALTIIGALIESSARRTQDLAYLRALGVSSFQALALTVVEYAPPVVLALVPGVALGIGVAFLLEPGLALGTFTGTSGTVPLLVDWPSLGLATVVLVAVVAVSVMAGTWLSRRTRVVDALRIGED
jgi:putative ABC transport system permease protein